MIELHEGMRVKVVHDNQLGGAMKDRIGRIHHMDARPPHVGQRFVRFPSGTVLPYFPEELETVGIAVIEGKCEVDGNTGGLTMVTVDNEDVYNFLWTNGFDGKRIRLTAEALDPKEG